MKYLYLMGLNTNKHHCAAPPCVKSPYFPEAALAAQPTPSVWRWVSATAAAQRIRSRTPAARRAPALARPVGLRKSEGKPSENHGKTMGKP